jgi:hypothetical protein
LRAALACSIALTGSGDSLASCAAATELKVTAHTVFYKAAVTWRMKLFQKLLA